MESKERKNFYIRLGVAISTLIFIVVVAFYPYPRSSGINRLFYIADPPRMLIGIKAFLISIITEGGGNFPNLVVILIYCALKTQRHRAFLHVLFYQAQYYLIGTLRQCYVGQFGALPYMNQNITE